MMNLKAGGQELLLQSHWQQQRVEGTLAFGCRGREWPRVRKRLKNSAPSLPQPLAARPSEVTGFPAPGLVAGLGSRMQPPQSKRRWLGTCCTAQTHTGLGLDAKPTGMLRELLELLPKPHPSMCQQPCLSGEMPAEW